MLSFSYGMRRRSTLFSWSFGATSTAAATD
jgi:hypothetical protein